MLVDLGADFVDRLSQRLLALPEAEKAFFNAHDYDVATLRNLLEQRDKHYYIYLDEHRNFAGYGRVKAWEGFDTPTLGCVVWPEYRRYGNAAKLVNELVVKARLLGFNSIKLKVSKKNAVAYRLYKSVGFRETGEVVPDGRIWMERKTS
jgi:ribosomal protein S18 acetylase RimI-like enzyme